MRAQVAIKDPLVERRLFFTRTLVAVVIVASLIAILAYRFYFLQIVKFQDFHTQSERNRVHARSVGPIRGLIFDRNGELLADNRPSYQLAVVKERVTDLQETLAYLRELLDMDQELISRFQKRQSSRRPFEAVPLKFQLTEREMALVAVNSHLLEGVEIEARPERYYPKGELFAHALGYVGRISEADEEKIDAVNYAGTHNIGKAGIEKYYESHLHGSVGYENVETNARGQVLRVLERTGAVEGKDLILHLDAQVQEVAFDAVEGARASVVAIDPNTGGVIAIVSTPSFDPNLFVGGISSKDYNQLKNNPDLPLFNRTVLGQYPPGSTVKPVMGLAGLEYGLIDEEYSVRDPGWYQLPNDERKYRDWKKRGHGHRVALHTSIVQSCDIFYYDLAYRMGIDRMHDFTKHFGLGRKTGIDLPTERRGILPSTAWKRKNKGQAWYPGETLIAGIGQGYMLATPLQLAVLTATIANKGKFISPRLLKSVSGQVPQVSHSSEFTLADAEHWETIYEAMRDVVISPRGTAHKINRGLKYTIAGKTGTAQVVGIAQGEEYDSQALEERQRDHALFIGFAPIENPQIVVAVVIENGEKSSKAALAVRKVMDAYLLNNDRLGSGR